MEEALRHEIVQVVQQRMRSFEAAERALDADRLISHFSGSEFYMYNDGQRLTYEIMAAAVRGGFSTLRSIEGGFNELDVIVLSTDAALATARFQETVTDHGGNQAVQHGAASWLWRCTSGEWRIAYGHVDHYSGGHQPE